MNFLDFLGDSVLRIINHAQDNRKEVKNEFTDGVDLGIKVALMVLQNDAKVYAETFDDEKLLSKLNLDFDLDKTFGAKWDEFKIIKS